MAKSSDVLNMLLPDGGYIATGHEYEGIQFLECKPITKKQYEDGFAKYDAWKIEQDAAKAAAKAALLDRLGMTADEARLLLE